MEEKQRTTRRQGRKEQEGGRAKNVGTKRKATPRRTAQKQKLGDTQKKPGQQRLNRDFKRY